MDDNIKADFPIGMLEEYFNIRIFEFEFKI